MRRTLFLFNKHRLQRFFCLHLISKTRYIERLLVIEKVCKCFSMYKITVLIIFKKYFFFIRTWDRRQVYPTERWMVQLCLVSELPMRNNNLCITLLYTGFTPCAVGHHYDMGCNKPGIIFIRHLLQIRKNIVDFKLNNSSFFSPHIEDFGSFNVP